MAETAAALAAGVHPSAGDELWLSSSYQRESLAIHFTRVNDAGAVAPVIAAVEERLAPLRPRPHWGTLFATPGEVLRSRYERVRRLRRVARRSRPVGQVL